MRAGGIQGQRCGDHIGVPGHTGGEAVTRLREFLIGQCEPFFLRGQLFARRGEVEQRAAHIGGGLFGDIASPHAEFAEDRPLLVDAAIAAAKRTPPTGPTNSHESGFKVGDDVVHPKYGDGVIVERLLGLTFEVVGNAFLQTNSDQAERLYEGTLAAAAVQPHETVLDLYCGAGTLTLLFARVAHEVIGVENVADSIERATRNVTRNGIGNARFELGDSRAVLREWARGTRPGAPRPDVVVVDPPRAGLHPRVVARVAELEPNRIVYVSCNPATLARDLKDFAALGWHTTEVTPYDMFPQTPHIECVTRLERREG